MSEQPREHYALPPETGPMPADDQQALWIGSCPVCSGDGVVPLALFGIEAPDPDDRVTCRNCAGSGIDPAVGYLQYRRLRDELV